jgi:hypothetical protein
MTDLETVYMTVREGWWIGRGLTGCLQDVGEPSFRGLCWMVWGTGGGSAVVADTLKAYQDKPAVCVRVCMCVQGVAEEFVGCLSAHKQPHCPPPSVGPAMHPRYIPAIHRDPRCGSTGHPRTLRQGMRCHSE